MTFCCYLFNIITNQRRNVQHGVSIICVKIKTNPHVWDPMGIGCGTYVVRDPPKTAVVVPKEILNSLKIMDPIWYRPSVNHQRRIFSNKIQNVQYLLKLILKSITFVLMSLFGMIIPNSKDPFKKVNR